MTLRGKSQNTIKRHSITVHHESATWIYYSEASKARHVLLIKLKRKINLNFGIVSGHKNLFLAIAIEIGNKGRREALSFVFDWVFFRKMKPRLLEREITLMLIH